MIVYGEDIEPRVGDIVTRDGSDRHRVVEADNEWGVITVECIVRPRTGWIEVGEREGNLPRRYELIEPAGTIR